MPDFCNPSEIILLLLLLLLLIFSPTTLSFLKFWAPLHWGLRQLPNSPKGRAGPDRACLPMFFVCVHTDLFVLFVISSLNFTILLHNIYFFLSPIFKAWELWTSDRGSDLVDPLLDDVSFIRVALKCVKIGLLCVQENAADRPTMSDVVAMLSNESTTLHYPKQPAFLIMRSVMKENLDNSKPEICSVNDATVSIMEDRPVTLLN